MKKNKNNHSVKYKISVYFIFLLIYSCINLVSYGQNQLNAQSNYSISPSEYSGNNISILQEQLKPLNRYVDSRVNQPSFNPLLNTPASSIGTHSDNIMEQNRASAMKMMGYTPPVIPPHQYTLQNSYHPSAQEQSMNECLKLINEVNREEQSKRVNFEYYHTPEFAAKTKSYWNSYNSLNAMLSGQKKLSIKEAYYIMESAYGNGYLSYKEFNQELQSSITFIKKWMTQNNLNTLDNEALNYAIQRFMKDTLEIVNHHPDTKLPLSKSYHYPFRYDYVDFKGETDHRNYFITKCVATGYGQCNSLPGIYLCLAEGIGAKAYLSLAPQHSFIKYPDSKGYFHNYEPTSHWNISDKWYQDNMFISTTAKRNGVYLDTLNARQIVADCMIDLALGYTKKFGLADAKFVGQCVQSSIKEFPGGNNLRAYFLHSSMLARMLDRELYKCKITDLKSIDKCPSAQEIYAALKHTEEIILKLGYQEIPEEMYLEMMKMHTDRKETQVVNNINTKQKRSLFETKQ